MDRPDRPPSGKGRPTLTERRKAEAAAREARLGEALRANLKRRRAQSAARAGAAEKAGSDPDGDST